MEPLIVENKGRARCSFSPEPEATAVAELARVQWSGMDALHLLNSCESSYDFHLTHGRRLRLRAKR